MKWTVETLDTRVDKEIEEIPKYLRGRLGELIEKIKRNGLETIREPHVKHIEGKLWELRAKAKEGIAREMYVTMKGRRIIILHAFVKKSQKTAKKDIEIARQRMKEIGL